MVWGGVLVDSLSRLSHSSCLWPRLLRLLFLKRISRFLGCKVLNWSDGVSKLFHVELRVGIEVHSSDDRNEQRVVWEDAALDKIPL